MPQLNLCHVAHLDWRSIHRLHRDVGNIFQILHHTDASDIILVGILLNVAATRIGIVALQGFKHLVY